MRQGTLSLGSSGLKVTDSPPTKTPKPASSPTKHKPVRQAFATQPDPDELSNGGESLDESEDDPDPELGSTSPQQRPVATESGAASEESSASAESESDSVIVEQVLQGQGKRVQASSSTQPVASTSATLVLGSDSDSDDEPIVSSMRKKQTSKPVSMFDDEASEASDFEDDVKFVPRRARPSASSQHVVPSSDSDEAPPAPNRSARKHVLEAMAAKSRQKLKGPAIPSVSSDATDSSDAPAPLSRKRKPSVLKRRKQSDSPVKRKKKYVQTAGGRSADDESASDIDDFLDDDDELLGAHSESSSSSSLPVKGKGKAVPRSRDNKARRSANGQNSGKGKGKARAVESESGSGSEDVDDLELSPPPEPRKQASSQRDYRKKKHAYLGAPSESESGSESGSESERGDAPSPGDDLDEELGDGFIVDEEEEDPDHVVAQYRDQQTRTAQGSKFFVKTYLQLLIHILICPKVDWRRTDDNFKGASDRVQRDLTGLTSSLIGSSAWRPNFKRAVDERPHFNLVDIDSSMLGAPCVACSMGNKRNSKFTGTTTGKRYDSETFRDLSDSAVTDSEDEGDDGKSHNLGEHCAGRAEVYHELKHWPYAAYHELKDAASSIRKSFPKLVKPTKQQKQERKDLLVADADRVAAELDANGTIKRIAGTFERMVDEATKGFAVN